MAQPPDRGDGARRRSGNPAVRAGASEPRSQARADFERRSVPLLRRLSSIPRWALLVVVLALVIVGLLVPGWVGALILLLVGALMVWLLAVSWPALSGRDRFVRILVIGIVVVDVVWKVTAGV